jgi:hypothetical protein
MNKKNKNDCLIHYKSIWNNGKTTTLRIPIVLKDDIKKYAECIDNGNIKYDELLKIYEYLKNVKSKLNITNGYKSNNSGKLIKELNDISNTLTSILEDSYKNNP